MKVEFTSKFIKQVESISDSKIRFKVGIIIDKVIDSDTLSGIQHIKKISGNYEYYRIRIGNYRMGFVLRGNVVIFAAFDHRSRIYKYFP